MDSVLERRLGQGRLDLLFPTLSHYTEEVMVENVSSGRGASDGWSLATEVRLLGLELGRELPYTLIAYFGNFG